MLVGQFLVGMAVNVFVKIPTEQPGANPPDYFSGVAQSVTWAVLHGNILLAIHAGFGLVLVVAAVGTLVQAIGNRRRGVVVSTILGFIGVLGAGFNGGMPRNSFQSARFCARATRSSRAVAACSPGVHCARDTVTPTTSPPASDAPSSAQRP